MQKAVTVLLLSFLQRAAANGFASLTVLKSLHCMRLPCGLVCIHFRIVMAEAGDCCTSAALQPGLAGKGM
jgi:hypothetical protein